MSGLMSDSKLLHEEMACTMLLENSYMQGVENINDMEYVNILYNFFFGSSTQVKVLDAPLAPKSIDCTFTNKPMVLNAARKF